MQTYIESSRSIHGPDGVLGMSRQARVLVIGSWMLDDKFGKMNPMDSRNCIAHAVPNTGIFDPTHLSNVTSITLR